MKTIKARYREGVIQPLEAIQFPEESELLITILDARAVPTPQEGPFSALAGAWVGLVDCERFMQEVYASRHLSPQRPAPQFEA